MIEENISLELAACSDAAEIADLSRELIEKGLGWRWTAKKVGKAINDRSTNVVVARDGNTLAGFGIMKYGYEKANLDLLAVRGAYRRSGTGTKIVRWLEEVASTAGIFYIYVQMREKNIIARKFYLNLGYEMMDKMPGYYRHIEDGVVMYRYTGKDKLAI